LNFLSSSRGDEARCVKTHGVAKWTRRAVLAAVCFVALSATAGASQIPGATYAADAPQYYSYTTRYYGTIEPSPIGYYPYSTYYGPTVYGPTVVSPSYGVGYYPYPQPYLAYVVPAPYAVGYYGYPAWPYPYYAYPGWGWGAAYPYFGF
jgi:hypothetical protein